MRILLDCDGVLGDFASEVQRWCSERLLRAVEMSEFTRFDLLEPVGLAHLQDDLDYHLWSINHCRNMPVYPGAQAFVEALRRGGDEVVVVTSPYEAVPDWCSERTKWLRRNFEIPKEDVILAKRKELVKGDWLVDDKTSNCEAFDDGLALCFDRPWNQDYRGIRVGSYDHALELLQP